MQYLNWKNLLGFPALSGARVMWYEKWKLDTVHLSFLPFKIQHVPLVQTAMLVIKQKNWSPTSQFLVFNRFGGWMIGLFAGVCFFLGHDFAIPCAIRFLAGGWLVVVWYFRFPVVSGAAGDGRIGNWGVCRWIPRVARSSPNYVGHFVLWRTVVSSTNMVNIIFYFCALEKFCL